MSPGLLAIVEMVYISPAWSHFFAAVLHFISASLLIGLANDSVMLPAYIHYAKWSPFFDEVKNITEPDCSKFTCVVTDEGSKYELNAAAMCFFFAYFSGACHLVIWWLLGSRHRGSNEEGGDGFSTPGLSLTPADQNTTTFIRAIDYSTTASTMIMLVLLVCGATDLVQLILSFICMFMVIWIDYLGEVYDAKWAGFCVASLVYLFVWFPLFWVYSISIDATPDVDPPEYVDLIVLGLFGAFTSFAFVRLYFLIKERKGSDVWFWTQDKVYIILSLTSKVALHWTLFFGVLQRDRITGEEHTATVKEEDVTNNVIGVVAGTFSVGFAAAFYFMCCQALPGGTYSALGKARI